MRRKIRKKEEKKQVAKVRKAEKKAKRKEKKKELKRKKLEKDSGMRAQQGLRAMSFLPLYFGQLFEKIIDRRRKVHVPNMEKTYRGM